MDKRDLRRIPVNLDASLHFDGTSCDAFIGDISENGLHTVVTNPLGAGLHSQQETDVLLSFRSTAGETIKLHCRKKWSYQPSKNNPTTRVGLELLDPHPEYTSFYQNKYYEIRNDLCRNAIAVVGMACYYPGAPDLQAFWENILARRREFRRMPDERMPLSEYYDPDPAVPDKTYATKAAVIDGFDFDWAKRGIPKSVIESSDIAHWLALEISLRALENAGYSRKTVPSERSGVILGNTLTGEHSRSENMRLRWPYVRKALITAASQKGLPAPLIDELAESMEGYYKSVFAPVTEDTLAGNLSNTIAGRICNFLNFNGGGYTVDGACSSSLIAVTTAATALSNGNMDMAIAGGVDISLDTFELVGFAKTNALTKEDMRVYDRRASGFIPGEGAGFVVLKRLEDARAQGNYIYSVLRGWGISSDGKGGLTAPKAETQAIAIRRAYTQAGYTLHDVDFIEGHGTGTPAGDKAELEAISDAMNDKDNAGLRSCGVTSLKSIIGHTKAASGIGGFIKASLAVNRRILPPTAGCNERNTVFEEKAFSLYPILHGEVRSRKDIIRAGVSGMGFGGINCHVTLESGDEPANNLTPAIAERKLLVSPQDTELFVFSADSREKMVRKVRALAKIAAGSSMGEMVDLAKKLTDEIADHEDIRVSIIASTPQDLVQGLERCEDMLLGKRLLPGETQCSAQQDIWIGNGAQSNRVGYLFPGQGSQQLNMGRTLVERHSWARDLVEQADEWLRVAGAEPVSKVIYQPEDRAPGTTYLREWHKELTRSDIAQPAICLSSLLWLHYLDRLGITPVASGGHSLGELMAFHAAGVMSAEELLGLAALRGQAMTSRNQNDTGTMASFSCDSKTLENLIKQVDGYAVVANINSPSQTVMSGESTAIEQAMQFAANMDIKTKRLPVANAFHSRFVTDAAEQLRKMADIPEVFKKNGVRLFSSIDGAEVMTDTNLRDHFASQVTAQVDFISLIENMRARCDLMLEVGPGRVLTGLAQAITGPDGTPCFPVESKATEWNSLHVFLGAYFVHGGDIKWPVLYENRLVRPFIPPAEKNFIDNPCERLFDTAEDVQESPRFGDSSFGNGNTVTEDAMGLFSSQQVHFIQNLIRSGLERSHTTEGISQELLHPGAANAMQKLPLDGKEEVSESHTHQGKNPEVLLELAAEMTGFPRESLSLDNRLLDNLNLDSIKAGQFVAKAVKLFGVEGKLDPTTMANSSLQEIYEAIAQVSPPQITLKPEPVLPPAEPERLLKLASEMTGFPLESITFEKRLLDDLNLDSIKAGQFVAQAVKLFDVEGKLDPTTMANSSIQEVYDEIRAHLPAAHTGPQPSIQSSGQQKISSLPPTEVNNNWVRNFRVTYTKQELTSPSSANEILSRLSSANNEVVIFTDASEDELIQDIRTVLAEHNVNVVIKNYDYIDEITRHDFGTIAASIYLLPVLHDREVLSGNQAIDMTRRLHRISSFITAMQEKEGNTSHTVVQFGNGAVFNACRDDNISLQSKGSVAFFSSIHLDNPDEKIRVLEFSSKVSAVNLLNRIAAELATEETFTIAGYDRNNVRHIPLLEPAESRSFQKRDILWSHDDVILVTGGAKGITAECALSFAQQTGVKLALVGRTPLIHNNEEIQQILERYRENNITYRYYACDISDESSVGDLVHRIEQDLGPVTGVFHGAAVNKPRRVEQAPLESVLEEMSPKLLGAINICRALRDKPPKLFAGLSSIIGVSGMMGNGWYGFSNEAMNLVLQEFATVTNKTEVISLAFSIWGETGMGARMGSVNTLQSMGILPIPTKGGVDRFLQLILNDPGEHQLVVSSRIAGLDTLNKHASPQTGDARFLEEILFFEKGVELEAKAVLTLDKDPYLKDHLFNSTYLFPTVFGLEAMMQAVVHVTGKPDIEHVNLENVILSYPITVSPDDETEIHIRALIEDPTEKEDTTRIKVGIAVDQTGFAKNHFEATFVLQTKAREEEYAGEIPATVLDIQPEEDLYGHMLFQGKLFQQIHSVRLLEETGCMFDAMEQPLLHDAEDFLPKRYAGDPYFRDTLLQSIQVFLPDVVALPVEIERWEIFRINSTGKQVNTVEARLTDRSSAALIADVTAIDQEGRITEKLHGYKAKIIEHKKNAPQTRDILNPDTWDEKQINDKLGYYCQKIKAIPPVVALKHLSGFHDLKKTQRHTIEETLFAKAYAQFHHDDARLPENITVAWTDAGRPMLNETDDAGISCSHDDRLCICSVGRNNQGCDLETVVHQSKEEWLNLLGLARKPLLEECANLDGSLDHAGTRIWCALETLRKATSMEDNDLKLADKVDECMIFRGRGVTILTLPVKLLRGKERILAFTVPEEEKRKKQHATHTGERERRKEEIHWGNFVHDDRLERKVFTCSLPISLRDNATIGGGVYFANYLHWLGKVREMSLRPIGAYIADEFFNGHFMVTNHSKIDVVGQLRNHDDLEARLWVDRIFGDKNSSLVLKCEWRKRLAEGDTKTVAYGEQQTTWVRVIGHGIVEPVACPRFFQNYLEENGFAPGNNSVLPGRKNTVYENSNLSSLGALIHETKAGMNGTASLAAKNFDTSMENSNLAQNIYFSNYFIWQGHVRDRFFFDLSPENYRQMNGNGQLLCLHSSVKHLREAMPFDRVLATMYLKKLYECGLDLYFEYHKIDPAGNKEKIAFGDHTMAWALVDKQGNYKLRDLPELYVHAMLKANGVGHGYSG